MLSYLYLVSLWYFAVYFIHYDNISMLASIAFGVFFKNKFGY